MSRILVIEDEPNLRKNILDFLELEGFEVLEASDGALGVEIARQHKPDLIISDISMPNMDGYNALLELRKDVAETGFFRGGYLILESRINWVRVTHGLRAKELTLLSHSYRDLPEKV